MKNNQNNRNIKSSIEFASFVVWMAIIFLALILTALAITFVIQILTLLAGV